MARKKKVAVLGASGYIGRHLMRALSSGRAGLEAAAVPRRGLAKLYAPCSILDHIDSYPFGEDPYVDDWDERADDWYHELVEDENLRKTMRKLEGFDVLVNLAGAGRQSAKNPYHVSIEQSATVAAFISRETGMPVVHLSGLGASPDSPIAYLASKYRAESIIGRSGTRHVILRPSYVVGGGDHLSEYVKKAAKRKRKKAPGKAGSRARRTAGSSLPTVGVYESESMIQPIYIDDAVSVIIKAALMLTKSRKEGLRKSSTVLDLVGPDEIQFYVYMYDLASNAGASALPITMEEAYGRALSRPGSAPFGVDDLGLITAEYWGDYGELVRATGVRPRSVRDLLNSGGLP